MRTVGKYRVLGLVVAFAACGGETDADVEAGLRLPLVYAPIDTMNAFDTFQETDSGVVESSSNVDLREPAWLSAHLAGNPSPKELRYVRHSNPQYGYAFVYPDTLFKPVQSIGDGRGIEFATSDDRSRILVYAIENAGREDLESQYQAVVFDSDARVTYRAREESWYIVAGTEREHAFYEKALLSGGVLKTFRINYPTEASDYFDAVTAVIASSFR